MKTYIRIPVFTEGNINDFIAAAATEPTKANFIALARRSVQNYNPLPYFGALKAIKYYADLFIDEFERHDYDFSQDLSKTLLFGAPCLESLRNGGGVWFLSSEEEDALLDDFELEITMGWPTALRLRTAFCAAYDLLCTLARYMGVSAHHDLSIL